MLQLELCYVPWQLVANEHYHLWKESGTMILSNVWRRSRRILGKGLYSRKLKKGTPIIVYQMGKVGSSSVIDSLKLYGLKPVFHIHRLNPNNIKKVRQEYLDHNQIPPDEWVGESLYVDIVKKRRKANFITLIREPISRNISAFFQNFERFTGIGYKNANLAIEELVRIFIKEYEHSVPLTWFDVEMKQTLGIDVYDYPFPKEKGYLSIKKGNFKVLILKSEIDDSVKENAIAEFLDIDEDLKLVRGNIGGDKEYAEAYRNFLEVIKLPKTYVEIMCNSEYTQHFYGDNDIESIQMKWNDNICQIELPPAVRQELLRASSRDVKP